MRKAVYRARLVWWLVAANVVVVAAVAYISLVRLPPPKPAALLIAPVDFSALPGWRHGDMRAAAAAFARSCVVLEKLPANEPMGWAGYAGRAAAWRSACAALPSPASSTSRLRAYFERWFVPMAIGGTGDGHFTGYYEPQLSASRDASQRYRVPVYGRPADLLSVDLGRFRPVLAGGHIMGRVSGTKLVPYWTRAEIDAQAKPAAPVLLYTDDPVSLFFLQIQGSGRVRFSDGEVLRLAYAATNGRPYTPIGRVLAAYGSLDKKAISLQTIRDWLETHKDAAQRVMEADQSYVFFALEALGDPLLGSPGTEGVPLSPRASIAVDPRFHPMGIPVYVAADIPDADPAKQSHAFDALLIAQDTGGAIQGAARGDIFFGFGPEAEAIAGRMNAHGRFFVFVPKTAAREAVREFAVAGR